MAFAVVADTIDVPVPGIKAIIACISMATGIDYQAIGGNAAKLGLNGKCAEDIRRMVR